MKAARHVIIVLSLFLVGGCVTDKLAVFEAVILTDKEMDEFIGTYAYSNN